MEIINDYNFIDRLTLNRICVDGDLCIMSLYAGKTEIQHKCLFDTDILNSVKDLRWTWSESGYVMHDRRNQKPRVLWFHHLILPRKKGIMIDHINGDKFDNRRINLRYATNAQNQWNSSCSRGESDLKGVTYCSARNTWRGFVKYYGKAHQSKDFQTEHEAADWVRAKREQLHGEFTNHGTTEL